ncbi:50S ribosomal protein L3 glutamine methyltransferase [Usitatibacter rugosus]|uniref:50S ribosomal protein L3 glutamine methyltransferase n=1 Tax=Usitatibacter rugosus TaxID=2732067 RepID=A0A6M4GTX4_9PROT|nr:50S ribosomal protein L3 N(5)-glutamine methyltransferase [Usitatibacter rugosus]QJR09944.1 50S ribosomal protein L3 glutamine methyltransferase [Usitatibacter rugosus]
MTVSELLDEAVARLEKADVSFGHGTTNVLDEAVWLLLHSLRLPLDSLNEHLPDTPTVAKVKSFRALVERRIATRKPAAYLLKEAWLGEHRFYVDERVIVPRSFIAEWMQPRRWDELPTFFGHPNRESVGSVLDLCTGSGCLAILAALMFPGAKVDGADLSQDALDVAKRNILDYGLARRIGLVRSDLFAALGERTYDLILSNPPYVKASSMKKLPAEYRAEPTLALASGRDGLDHTRTILREAAAHLNPGGMLVVEIGHNRKALERAFPRLPFKWPETSSGAGYVFTLRREELAL